ncbi:MAG: nucleoside hydrolase [Kiritimatiellia bacterium]|nr:nucleoside hydrolase [Kiritimatiellia bacterium]
MNTKAQKKIPVILDTDIGGDIDDTWALAMLLKSPELDTKLITTCFEDTTYRAKIVAKMLAIGQRADIPVGIGQSTGPNPNREGQKPWVENYDLSKYPGRVLADGVQAMIDTIMKSPEPVTLIGIGPLTNVAEALKREPRIAGKCRFVGMQGSVYRGHNNDPTAITEFNVVKDIPACQKTFTAPWREMILTPLDTCGSIRLQGDKYAAICASKDTLTRTIIENYRIWLGNRPENGQSTVLFDTVAVYLAFSTELLVMERLGIKVTDQGFTVVDPKAKKVNCALNWQNLSAYEDFLVERLIGKKPL